MFKHEIVLTDKELGHLAKDYYEELALTVTDKKIVKEFLGSSKDFEEKFVNDKQVHGYIQSLIEERLDDLLNDVYFTITGQNRIKIINDLHNKSIEMVNYEEQIKYNKMKKTYTDNMIKALESEGYEVRKKD
jgi:hypothetical protein